MKAPDLLKLTAKRFPDKPAIHDSRGSLTYKELVEEIGHCKMELEALGIKRGMGVAVAGKNSREFIVMMFAVMDVEAVAMPLSDHLKLEEIESAVNTAGLHAVLFDENTALPSEGKGMGSGWKIIFTEKKLEKAFASMVANPAFIRFTSGTTGVSKGVVLSHQAILERTEAANEVLKLDENDSVIWVLSMAYHFVVSIILYLRYGSSIVICENFVADEIIEQTNRYNGTFFYGSPMHIRLLANDLSGRRMPSLRQVISTSSSISGEQCETFRKRYGIPVSQAYGIIEIGLPIINLEKPEEEPDAVGYAVPAYTVEILDEQGHILPPEEVGHLAIKGPGMFDAYLEPPRLREEVLQKGWFLTGDLASKRKDGLIRIEGRKKSMINVSGNKVFPEEVEQVLNQHPAIDISKVSGFIHRFLGESVQAEVVLKKGEKAEVEELIDFCRRKLSTYKVPQKITFVYSLPMTGSGKLIRHKEVSK